MLPNVVNGLAENTRDGRRFVGGWLVGRSLAAPHERFLLFCLGTQHGFGGPGHDCRSIREGADHAAGEFRGREMGDVFLRARILAVEVAAAREQLGGGDFPRALVFLALAPPGHEGREFLDF